MARGSGDGLRKIGRVWHARIYLEGREVSRSLRTGNRQEAERRLKTLREQEERRQWGDRTWEDAVVEWRQVFVDGGSVKPRTAKRYLCSARALDPFWSGRMLADVTKGTVAQYVASRRGVSNATIRRDLTVITSVLDVAEAAGWIPDNPARTFNRRVIRERREPIPPPPRSAIDAVIAAATPAFGAMIRFAAETGCRQDEAAGLEWQDVRGDGTVVFTRTKTSRPRVVQLATPGGRVQLVRPVGAQGPVWGRRFKNVASNFAALVRRVAAAAAEAGQEFRLFRFHDMRHAFAVRWLAAGGDIYELQHHLGHASVTTTEVYLRWVAHRERHHAEGLQDRGWPEHSENANRERTGKSATVRTRLRAVG